MVVNINESIAGWLKKGDHLGLTLGKLKSRWHIVLVSMIGSDDPSEPSPVMYSVPNDYTESDYCHAWLQ